MEILIDLATVVFPFAICWAVVEFLVRRRDRLLKKRLWEGHEWGPVREGGPLEEGGECVYCGAWATSEERTECWPPRFEK